MTHVTAVPAIADRPAHPTRRESPELGRKLTAWLLLLCWLVAIAGAVVEGERHSTASDLIGAIADGDVHHVQASGGLGGFGTGYATVHLRWREHGVQHSAEVVQIRGRHHGRVSVGGGATGRFTGDLDDYLTSEGGSIAIEHSGDLEGGLFAEYAGWEVRGWTAALIAALFVLTVLKGASGPEPWRATRWAWFWLMLAVPPIACPAYLLVGGPTGLAPPSRPERRMTGGWAFLLGMLLGGLGSQA